MEAQSLVESGGTMIIFTREIPAIPEPGQLMDEQNTI